VKGSSAAKARRHLAAEVAALRFVRAASCHFAGPNLVNVPPTPSVQREALHHFCHCAFHRRLAASTRTTTLIRRRHLTHPHIRSAAMAPTNMEVDELKSTVSKLEQRIAQLEGRLAGNGGGSSAPQESVRMILMGPPGAGTWSRAW